TVRGYPDRTAPARAWQTFMSERQRRQRRFGGGTTLSDLAKANVLRLGVQIICPHCQKKNWYSIDDVAYSVSCGRCLGKFEFPEGDLSATNWHYRVVGPFSVPDYA